MNLLRMLGIGNKSQEQTQTRQPEQQLPPIALFLEERRKSQEKLTIIYEKSGEELTLFGYVTHKPYMENINFGPDPSGYELQLLYFDKIERTSENREIHSRILRVLDSQGKQIWDYAWEKAKEKEAQAS